MAKNISFVLCLQSKSCYLSEKKVQKKRNRLNVIIKKLNTFAQSDQYSVGQVFLNTGTCQAVKILLDLQWSSHLVVHLI